MRSFFPRNKHNLFALIYLSAASRQKPSVPSLVAFSLLVECNEFNFTILTKSYPLNKDYAVGCLGQIPLNRLKQLGHPYRYVHKIFNGKDCCFTLFLSLTLNFEDMRLLCEYRGWAKLPVPIDEKGVYQIKYHPEAVTVMSC